MRLLAIGTAFFILTPLTSVSADERADFFEKKIRPVLVQHCYKCHSPDGESVQGGLRLDTAELTRTGGDSGPAVVPGKPNDSLLLSALTYEDFEMPPTGKLSDDIIANFRKWIEDGAHDPRTGSATKMEPAGVDIEEGRKFWAFQPPKLATSIGEDVAGSDRIDALVGQRLTEARLDPNPTADRWTLIRRLSLDLLGLPQSYEEVARFVDDGDVEATVDQMLESKAYGQRWARLWLDVARFAEDQAHIVGNNKALFYPNAYIYRDWVIDALNSDMPYDQFVRLQLAADLIEPDSEENLPALGFLGLGPKYYRRGSLEVMAEEWEDRVDVVSRGLQGLTVACARCHDHKYDPIATEDYYALAGVFASTNMFNKPLQSLRKKPKPAKKNAKQKKNNKPGSDETLHVIREGKPRDLKVMIRGKVDSLGDTVPRGFLQVMFPGSRRSFTDGSGRRELAETVTDRSNPLTARVIVNRVWKQYFGQGLVATPSNFGELGERPTHPELLDDLAVRFMDHGWSLKWLHREIVFSKTYQRSSALGPAADSDPANKLLWRVPRRKLSVEAWRDSVLAAAGTLDVDSAGKSIKPDDPNETRRTIYSTVSRFELNPLLAKFDFPDPNVHAATRSETDTPLQKLFLMNSPFMLAQAEKLASRAETESKTKEETIDRLFAIAYQRRPDEDERAAMLSALASGGTVKQLAQSVLISNEFWYLD